MTTTTIAKPGKLATVAIVARVVLGLIFSLSGLNHLIGLVPMPAMAGDTALFWQGLAQTGYFLPLLGIVELGAGLLLVWGRMVPLALAVVAPIIANIAAFHAVLAPQGLGVVAVVLSAAILLGRSHRGAFARILSTRPGARSTGVRAVEVLLGLVFVASGIAGLLGRTPPPATLGAAAMMKGLAASGYFFPALCATQVLAGALLVSGRQVGLALVALAPVVIEIFAYRVYVAAATPWMMLVATAMLAAEVWLGYAHRRMFAPLGGGGWSPSPGRG